MFTDETWAKTNMTRRHGRCRRGARLVAKAAIDIKFALTADLGLPNTDEARRRARLRSYCRSFAIFCLSS